MLVCQGWGNKLPQSWWRKTIETSFLSSESQNSEIGMLSGHALYRVLEKEPSPASFSSREMLCSFCFVVVSLQSFILLLPLLYLYLTLLCTFFGLPGVSVGEEPACNTGDVCLIPGSGISARGGDGNSLQYFSCRILWTEEPGGLQRVTESDATEQAHSTLCLSYKDNCAGI